MPRTSCRSGSARGSTYVVADTLPRTFFTGHSQHVAWDDLAEFTLRQGASVPGARAATWVTSPSLPLETVLLSTSPPATSKTYLQEGYAWKHAFNQIGPKYAYVLGYETPGTRYKGAAVIPPRSTPESSAPPWAMPPVWSGTGTR